MIRTALECTFVAIVATLVSATTHAAESQLILAGGDRLTGELTQLRDNQLVLAPNKVDAKTFTAGEWMRWGNLAQPAPRPTLYFANRSLLVSKVDWTGKVPASIDAETVTITTTTFGAVRLPRRDARLLLVEAAKEPELVQRLLRESTTKSAQDRVWLVDGDLLTGNVLSFDGTTLELDFSGQSLPVPASSIAAVAFATDEEPTDFDALLLLGLEDGSLLEATSATFDAKKLIIQSVVELASKTVPKIAYLQALAYPIIYLSDLDPIDFRHTPYFAGEWPLGRDQSLTGESLQTLDVRYAKGLAMHSASRAVYRVPEGVLTFVADVALDQSAENHGSVVFRVYVVTAEGLQPAYESPVVRGGDAPIPVAISLAGASAVVLVVDYADYGDERDHANWLDARFVR